MGTKVARIQQLIGIDDADHADSAEI